MTLHVHISGQKGEIFCWHLHKATLIGLFSKALLQQSCFLEFVQERVLPHCSAYPEPHSVLILDNASIHKSAELRSMCEEKGVPLAIKHKQNPVKMSITTIAARTCTDKRSTMTGVMAGTLIGKMTNITDPVLQCTLAGVNTRELIEIFK